MTKSKRRDFQLDEKMARITLLPPSGIYVIDPNVAIDAGHARNDNNHTPDIQEHKLPDIDMDSLLKIALLASVDLLTLRNSVHTMFGIMLSIEELKKRRRLINYLMK